ncbi:MAG: transporter large permease [candidate division NC10 bacterium]|nr:transporter large permease [candidate division NC10 bacterium]
MRESELRRSDEPAAARLLPNEPVPFRREAWPSRLSRLTLELAGGGLLALESGLVLTGVFFRYALNSPLYWAEEAARLLLIWLSFVGAALAFQRNQHLAMDVVVRLLPDALRVRIQVLVAGAGVAFCVAVIQQTIALMVSRWTRVSPVMSAPYLLFALPLAIGLAFGAGYLVAEIARLARQAPRIALPAVMALPLLAAAGWFFAEPLAALMQHVSPLTTLVAFFAVTLCVQMPIAICLGTTAMVYLYFYGGVPLSVIPQRMLAGVDSFVLLAVPLFILGGALMETSGISQRIVDLAMVIVGRMRGGLGQVVVVTEILFSGISGSATADVAAVGSLMIPSMKRSGYSSEESASILCAAAAMGILIPPSIHMVVLGTLVNVSVAKLFIAGFLPAFVMAAGLMWLINIKARRGNWPRATERVAAADVWRAGKRAIIPLMTPIIIFGGIFSGATTITESAVLAVAYAVVVGTMVYKEMSWRATWRIFVASASTSGVAMLLVGTATVFGWSLVTQRLPHMIAEWMTAVSSHPWVFLALTILLYLIFSDLLEGLPALLIFAPILYPTAEQLHVDPVHFGIVSIAALGLGFFLPPAALGLSLSCSLAGSNMGDTVKVFWIYVLVLMAGLLVIAFVPAITLVALKLIPVS